MCARFPFHCAGFGPCRYPRTVAASSTASILPRTRPAVSGFSIQISSTTFSTSRTSMDATGMDISGKGIAPLLPVLCAAPAGLLRPDEFFGNLAEGFSLGIGEALRLSPRLLRNKGINPVPALVPVLYRAPSRLCERHIGIGAEAHVSPLSVELESENPGPRPGRRDPKIE